MALEDLVGAERDRYVGAFHATLAQAVADHGQVAGELLISINNESLPYPYRYLRVDAVRTDSTGTPVPMQFDLGSGASFEPRGFDYGPFAIEAYPFDWSRVQFLVDREPPKPGQIAGWITRWLDIEDTGIHAHNGLTGAVHSFSPIETNGTWWYITADFGTAPGDAMVEFLELLGSQGLPRIVVRSE